LFDQLFKVNIKGRLNHHLSRNLFLAISVENLDICQLSRLWHNMNIFTTSHFFNDKFAFHCKAKVKISCVLPLKAINGFINKQLSINVDSEPKVTIFIDIKPSKALIRQMIFDQVVTQTESEIDGFIFTILFSKLRQKHCQYSHSHLVDHSQSVGIGPQQFTQTK